MNETNNKILELIKENYTLNDITKELGLSRKQLYYRLVLLKNKGYQFKQNFYENGETTFSFPTCFDLNKDKDIDIITDKNSDEFRALVISDLHLGANKDNIDALYQIYNYAMKNNIHNIINCGDLIDGIGGSDGTPRINDLEKQIKYLIENYPFDKNILNYTILGNHDVMPLYRIGLDLKQVLENQRLDIIPIGYDSGHIYIKNARICVSHPIYHVEKDIKNSSLRLSGHRHTSKFYIPNNNETPHIYVPSLSNVNTKMEDRLYQPQALDITFSFKKGDVTSFYVKNLLVRKRNCFIINEFEMSQVKGFFGKRGNIIDELPTSKIILPDESDTSLEKEKTRVLSKQ